MQTLQSATQLPTGDAKSRVISPDADTLLGTATVAEMLMYTAELKCSIKEPRASKAARVEKLLDDLNLQVRPCPEPCYLLTGSKCSNAQSTDRLVEHVDCCWTISTCRCDAQQTCHEMNPSGGAPHADMCRGMLISAADLVPQPA